MESTYTYRCHLVRVVDGDTVIVEIDLGFRLTTTLPIRLQGINTPELSQASGKAARAWVIAWFEQRQAELVITTAKAPEKYGRWLGTIHSQRPEPSLNDALVSAGVATPYMTVASGSL